MDLDTTVKTINKLLEKKKPKTFSSTLIHISSPAVYTYIRINLRTENDHIDWDRFTYALNKRYVNRWQYFKRKVARPYENQTEVDVILTKHKDKFYTFVALGSIDDKEIRNRIVIALVRIAQKGNILAQQELLKWLRYMVDDWIEKYYQLFKWKGYGEDIDDKIRACIRFMNQSDVCKEDSNLKHTIKVIFFFSDTELECVNRILRELDQVVDNKEIFLVDCRKKESASNKKYSQQKTVR